ncbi:MAG: TerB family tellurite resistance protein, partial [Nannocystaceae bacterium]|nr:TerB family tellurite resistance protein [Nannocystaceae bacterium]
AGVVALVPVAGTALSITGETFLLLKLHAQMTFELAAVYGWDIREGDNLYLMSMMLMGEGLATEAADVLISNFIVPSLAKRLATRLGVTLGEEVAKNVANRSLGLLVSFFSRKAQEEIATAALEGTARGIGKTILGWATLGAAVLVSAAVDAAVTLHLGKSVLVMSKRWLSDLMFEGSTYLAGNAARDCAFRGMAAMAWRDGEVSEQEKNLFVAFLAKPYALDEQTWFHLQEDEVQRQAEMVASWTTADSLSGTRSCLEDEFQSSSSSHRVSLLGHVYSMMLIDGQAADSEEDLYAEYRDGLDGSGWFDGGEIDYAALSYVERSLFLTANPGIVIREMAPEHAELADQVLTEDVFEFLESPNPAIRAQFDCGFDGECG